MNTAEKSMDSTFRSVTVLSSGGRNLSCLATRDLDKALKWLVAQETLCASASRPAESSETNCNLKTQSYSSDFSIPGRKHPFDVTLETTMRIVSSSSVNCFFHVLRTLCLSKVEEVAFLNHRYFLISLTGMDVPILYAPVPFENAAFTAPEDGSTSDGLYSYQTRELAYLLFGDSYENVKTEDEVEGGDSGEEVTSKVRVDTKQKERASRLPIYVKEGGLGIKTEKFFGYICSDGCVGFCTFAKAVAATYAGNHAKIPHVLSPWPEHRVKYMVQDRGMDRQLNPLEFTWDTFFHRLLNEGGRIVFKVKQEKERIRVTFIGTGDNVRADSLHKYYLSSYCIYLKAVHLLWLGWLQKEAEPEELECLTNANVVGPDYVIHCLDGAGQLFHPPSPGKRLVEQFMRPWDTYEDTKNLLRELDAEEFHDFYADIQSVVVKKRAAE